METPEASDGVAPTQATAPSAEGGDKKDEVCGSTDAADAAKPSSEEKEGKVGDEGKKVETAIVVTKADLNGPKCVELKMKPDWRKGSNKRRRGDLAEGAGGGGRWAWPADRPEFCRFVLYKENSDTVSGEPRVVSDGIGCTDIDHQTSLPSPPPLHPPQSLPPLLSSLIPAMNIRCTRLDLSQQILLLDLVAKHAAR